MTDLREQIRQSLELVAEIGALRHEIRTAGPVDDAHAKAFEDRIAALEARLASLRHVSAGAPALPGIHEAGPLEYNVQLCRRCTGILSDYRGAMIPVGDPPLVGWAIGSHVEIAAGNPRSAWLTDAAPDCKVQP